MGRSAVFRFSLLIVVIALAAILGGCGSSSTTATNFPTPAAITLTPGSSVSIDLGATQTFTSSAHDASNPPKNLTIPISYHSSNAAVVTIANNGLACAGTWNSLSSPQICTPGQSGVSEITATSAGVSSPPTTIYVHQHIDSVTVGYVSPPTTPCISKGGIVNFQAKAFSHGADITSSVGQFTWQTLNAQVVTVSNLAIGLPLNQAEATAVVPGLSQIFASIGGANSVPFPFTTCLVKSIGLAVSGTTSTSFTVTQLTTKDIVPTVIDTQNVTITGVPLTFCSSNSTVAAIGGSNCGTNTGALVNVTTPKPGSAAITASCTPPTCNIGTNPTRAIYPMEVITAIVNPSTGSAPAGTVYVTSTACPVTAGCAGSAVVPIAFLGSTNTVGAPFGLPADPNSLIFGPQGTAFFMGTNVGLQGTRGLMRVDVSGAVPTVNEFNTVTGKVLAISPTGNKVIVSDTNLTPNQVFVFDNASNTATPFQIQGATAAAFSVDGLKAFIVAGSKLYIYSTVNALQSQSLGFTGTDVTFLSEGAFGYVAGPSSLGTWWTCDNVKAAPTLSVPGTPSIIRSLPDGHQLLAVNSPNIDVISVDTFGGPVDCEPPVSNMLTATVNLGQGAFNAKQLLLSPDGTTAYVIAPNLPNIPAFSIINQTSTAIPLAGNAFPLAAVLIPDGTLMYVAASDGTIHVINTLLGGDVQQITFPASSYLCAQSDGTALFCPPDLITVKP